MDDFILTKHKILDQLHSTWNVSVYNALQSDKTKEWKNLSRDQVRAQHVIDLIAQFYVIENQARKENYTPQQRFEIRQQKSKPIMTQLKTYLQNEYESGNVRPKSAIGQAIQYALERWKYQERYLKDGHIEIDNNGVEYSIRPIAIGGKNYLFAGSETGAQWAAIFYTLSGSALQHGHNPLVTIKQ